MVTKLFLYFNWKSQVLPLQTRKLHSSFILTPQKKLTTIVKSTRGSLTANFILFTLGFTFNEIIATALRQGEEDAQKAKWRNYGTTSL